MLVGESADRGRDELRAVLIVMAYGGFGVGFRMASKPKTGCARAR